MAQVKAILDCFIDNSFRRVGEVFYYNGQRNDCVEVLEGEFAGEATEQPKRGRKPKSVIDATESVS
jgi:hypothetical protein